MKNFMSQTIAAAYLSVSPRTLEKWRLAGTGPNFARLGGSRSGRVIYNEEDLNNYVKLNTQETKSTA